MVETVAVPARSVHGCWTCRLRKKKCDETHPVCSVCISLRLECHGYGARPEWMDNGTLQRQKASKVKHLVSWNKLKKAVRRPLDASQPPQAISWGDELTIGEILALPVMAISQDNPHCQASELDLNFLFAPVWDSSPLSSTSITYSSFNLESFTDMPVDPQNGNSLQSLLSPGFVEGKPIRGSTSSIVQATSWSDEATISEILASPATPSLSSTLCQHSDTLSQVNPYDQASASDVSFLSTPGWDLSPLNAQSVLDLSFDLESFTKTHANRQNGDLLQYLVSPGFVGRTLVQVPTSSIVQEVGDVRSGVSWLEDFDCMDPNRERSNSKELQDHESHQSRSPEETTPTEQLDCSAQPLVMGSGAEDNALFMHYLDKVFYVQYPFYRSQDRQGRGWLFSILSRVKSAYYGALALSERHLLATPRENDEIDTGIVDLRTQKGHYDLALQGTRTMVESTHRLNGPARLFHSLEALTSILNLFFWELFSGGTENWQTHLRAASSFVPVLLQTRRKVQDLIGTGCANDQPRKIALLSEDDSAVVFLLGSFIRFDIISSASTRSTPHLGINHLEALDTLEFSLESLVGCSNSIVSLIFEISLLDSWKKEAQVAQKLSIVDLAKRGSRIKECLRQELAVIENGNSGGMSYYMSSKAARQPTHPEISRIFALSAITYLHVVISGAYPELPEIKESVSETMVALKALKDPGQLRSLVWPFCISGCLALEEHHGFFRDLVFRADVTPRTPGTCLEAYHIMKECWETRVTCSDGCDWTTAMNKRGRSVILA